MAGGDRYCPAGRAVFNVMGSCRPSLVWTAYSTTHLAAGCRLSRSRRSTPASVRPDCTRAARSIHGPVGGGERWL